MAFAILRIEKLKKAGNIGGLNTHLTRSAETPNADKELLKYNSRPIGSNDLWKDVKTRIEAAGITKLRKDGVLAVEHVITASPEHFSCRKEVNNEGQPVLRGNVKRWKAFEKATIEWLQERYGKENLVNVTVHMDEKNPHLHAIVVPIRGGKLNCKSYLGGREKLRDMQSSFAEKVKDQGLERGIEGSKAHHTEVKHFYGQIKQVEELRKAAEGATLLKQENEQIQATLEAQQKELGTLTKENDELKQKLQEAGTLLEHIAKGNVQASELKKALEQIPHKGNQREEAIWRVMKASGLKVKEPEQQKQKEEQVKQKPKGPRM